MIFIVEFYRVRARGDARATLDRIPLDTLNLKTAIARLDSLFRNRAMPQVPDNVRIWDPAGHELYSGPAARPGLQER